MSRWDSNDDKNRQYLAQRDDLLNARAAVIRLAVTVKKLDVRGWQDKTVSEALKLAGVTEARVQEVLEGAPWPGAKQ
jgi:hypothetical protein